MNNPHRMSWQAPHTLITCVLALGVAACTGNQADANNAPEDASATPEVSRRPTVPEGTSLTFRVNQDVSTETQRQGDSFTAALTGDAAGVEANTVLPAGTESRWVVSESTENGADGKALLAVRLESIRVDGNWIPVTATVTSSDLVTDDPDSNTETAAKIGIGAAAGAIVGQVLGKDTESTLKGAGVGAALGTAIALSTRGGSAKIKAGSKITVRLDKPLTTG